MKILFKFEKNKIEKVEKRVKDEQGQEIVTQEQKITPYKFAIIKPSRSIQDDAEVYYNITYARAIKQGQLTRAQLIKRISNDNGVWSEAELKKFDELKTNLAKKQEEYTLLRLKKDDDRTDEDRKKADQLSKDLFNIFRELQQYELAQESLFNRTAENYAFARYIVWYILYISAKLNDKDEPIHIFEGKTFDDKLVSYDVILDSEDDFLKEVIREFTFLISSWINGSTNNDEEFNRLLNAIRNP